MLTPAGATPAGERTPCAGSRAGGRGARWAAVVGFAGLVVLASVWLALDRHPPEWDYANHLERAIECARGIRAGDWDAILGHSPFYPPVALCAAGLAYLIAPTDMAAGGAAMIAALGLGMLATYLLARPLTGEAGAAVAALLYGTAPYVVFSILRLQLDLPLAAMVALSLVVIRAAEGLRHPGWAVLAGLVLGLGMLTKPTFALYVAPALIWLLRGMRRPRGLVNGVLVLGVATAVALPWYGPRLFGLPSQVAWRAVSADETVHLDPQSLAAMVRYLAWFPSQFGVAAAAVFAVGLVVAIRQRRWWVLASLLGPLLVVEAQRNKNLRYTLPLLPLVAVVAAMGWRAFPRAARVGSAAVLAAVAAVQVSATAFDRPHAAHVPFLGVPLGVPSPPAPEDWRHREILALLAADSGGRAATVSVVPNHPLFSVSNFRYYALRDGLPFEFARAWDGTPVGIEYAILKTGDVGPPWTERRIRSVTASLDEPGGLGVLFPVIGRFPLPDGSEAVVRARRLQPVPGASSGEVAAAAERAFGRWIADYARDVEGGALRLRYDERAREGRIAEVALSAERVTFAEFRRPRAARLRMHGVRVVVEDVLINPLAAVEHERVELLDVGRLRLERGTITADDLGRFLGELPKFKARVVLEPGALSVTIGQLGPDVSGRVRVVSVEATPLPVSLVPEDVRIGALALPDTVVGWVMRQYDPTGRIARRLVMPVTVGRIAVQPSAVTIGAEP